MGIMRKCPSCSRLLLISSFKYWGRKRYSIHCKTCLRGKWSKRKRIKRGKGIIHESERDKRIKKLRNRGLSLVEIGKMFGLSRQRIHQIIGHEELVYIIKCNEFYKIGFTCDPHRRIQEFKNANPYPIEVIVTTPICDAGKAEGEIHALFKIKNHQGEWFKGLTKKDIQIIKRYLEEKKNCSF